MVPSATLRTRDGKYAIIGGNGDSVYSRLMAAVGAPSERSVSPAAVQLPGTAAHGPPAVQRGCATRACAAGRPDMDSRNPAYADNARRCEAEAEIYQARRPPPGAAGGAALPIPYP